MTFEIVCWNGLLSIGTEQAASAGAPMIREEFLISV